MIAHQEEVDMTDEMDPLITGVYQEEKGLVDPGTDGTKLTVVCHP